MCTRNHTYNFKKDVGEHVLTCIVLRTGRTFIILDASQTCSITSSRYKNTIPYTAQQQILNTCECRHKRALSVCVCVCVGECVRLCCFGIQKLVVPISAAYCCTFYCPYSAIRQHRDVPHPASCVIGGRSCGSRLNYYSRALRNSISNKDEAP